MFNNVNPHHNFEIEVKGQLHSSVDHSKVYKMIRICFVFFKIKNK